MLRRRLRAYREKQDRARNYDQQHCYRKTHGRLYLQQERSVVIKEHVASIGPPQDTFRTHRVDGMTLIVGLPTNQLEPPCLRTGFGVARSQPNMGNQADSR